MSSSPAYTNIENQLKDYGFELVNKEEILNFISQNTGLLDLITSSVPIIKKYFQDCNYVLEFEIDPEISDLSQLVLYVKVDDDSFDESWEKMRILNKEIRNISYENSLNGLFSVDLL